MGVEEKWAEGVRRIKLLPSSALSLPLGSSHSRRLNLLMRSVSFVHEFREGERKEDTRGVRKTQNWG